MKKPDRLFPQNIEAESGVLGSLIIDPEVIVQVADHLTPDDFYRDTHRLIYQTILRLYERREPADFITICDELERNNELHGIGGPAYITSLINGVPTSGNALYYAQIIAQKALYRRLIHVASEIAAAAYAEESHAAEYAEQLLFSLSQTGQQTQYLSLGHVLSDCAKALDALHSQKQEIIGVPTGFRPVDVPLGGLQKSDLIILAARPGVGKTAWALNVAYNAAFQYQQHVGIFSLEMNKQQLGFRLLSLHSQMDQQRLRMGWVDDEDWKTLVDALEVLEPLPIWIDDTPGLSISSLRTRARQMCVQHGLDLLIVDYLQLMHATIDGKRITNREQEISEISHGLKAIAKELNIPVLALAQLSRAVESRQSKMPQLSDLRESGSIEQDADVVLFIYRDEIYNPENLETRNTADIIIAKHRNGPVGTVRLGFQGNQTRFF